MFVEGRRRERRAQVDMSPLVDVVFLLLIFFAVTTTFLEQSGMDLELPESSTATASERSDLVVELGNDGSIRFAGETVTVQQLEQKVATLEQQDRSRVTVRADRRVELAFFVAVVDALRHGGVEGVSVPMIPIEQ